MPDVDPASKLLPPDLPAALRAAGRVVALTGAGVSAESGIPTFREAEGLWARYDPEEMATPEAFARAPQRVYAWYAWRRERMAASRPNPAHRALAAMERRLPDFTLITQNVDGLHRAAGSRRLLELHGDLRRDRCQACGRRQDPAPRDPSTLPPPCPACGGPLRPDVVWFGETLDPRTLNAAWDAAVSAELFLSVGTSGLVEPAASLAVAALESGARVVEVNPEPTLLAPFVDAAIAGPAGEVLPALVAAAWGRAADDLDGAGGPDGA